MSEITTLKLNSYAMHRPQHEAGDMAELVELIIERCGRLDGGAIDKLLEFDWGRTQLYGEITIQNEELCCPFTGEMTVRFETTAQDHERDMESLMERLAANEVGVYESIWLHSKWRVHEDTLELWQKYYGEL